MSDFWLIYFESDIVSFKIVIQAKTLEEAKKAADSNIGMNKVIMAHNIGHNLRWTSAKPIDHADIIEYHLKGEVDK
ncbi:hypothetical protein LCGC14_0174510 [marine sediment metagenome]|uniref:Uncharacterized protein n=1 Tax=marine sediment metagenome TaxID=412755 RepID=A0A0F9V789_9ZZZZ